MWQREYWDRWIRDEQHYVSTIRYIEQNPVKAGHVADPTHWRWSSAHPGTANLQAGSNPGAASPQAGIGSDHTWMLRALRIASLSLGTTWPNPGVGCILVRDGQVLGEGHTGSSSLTPQQHGEAAALADAAQRGHDVRGATAYVTLAPCITRSTGTTSCSQLLIAAGIARVVVGIDDPHQQESAARLTAAGIAYERGPCASEVRHLHGGFLSRITAKRPRFTGKWAMTLDGCLAAYTGKSGWISSPEALALSRRRRRAFDAILIGAGTQQADDPQLLASRPRTRGPLRILVSADATVADDARLLQTLDLAPLLVIHGPTADPARLTAWGAELQALEDPHDVTQLARTLGAWGLNDVLVEGGAAVHGAFLRAGLYDRLELYHGATTLGGGLPVAAGLGAPAIPDGQHWLPEGAPRLLGTTILSRWTRTPS